MATFTYTGSNRTASAGTTGTGLAVAQTSPALVTPSIGAATGTSLSTTGAIISTLGYLAAGSSAGGVEGNIAMYSTTTGKGTFQFVCKNNANAYNVIVQNASYGQSSTLTIPDVGAATGKFIMSTGAGQTIGAGLTLTTPAIGAATATSINFGGSTLSTYTANGTWTPVFTFETIGDLSVSYSTQVGTYSRIGNIVTISALMVFTPTFTTSASSAQITGIPFTASSVAGSAFPGVLWRTGFAAPTNVLKDFVYMGQSYTFLYMYGNTATGTTTPNFDVGQFTSGVACTIRFVLTYFV